VSVRVDHRGVEVRFGPLRWPKKSIALAKIRTAKVIEVEPLAWGGWGYRRRKGATAIVLRRGQGLEIEEHDHHRTIVTIDDSRTAAGLINDLVARDGSHG
jgi:hypothetical protein